MSERTARLYKYTVRFKGLTKKLYEERKDLYQKCVIAIRLEEMQEKCGYLKKIYAPTKNGTLMTFGVFDNAEEYEKEFLKISEEAAALGLQIDYRREEE